MHVEGYDHILSFRHMMFINQEEASNLAGSKVINYNITLFRIFFIDKKSHVLHVKL